MELTEHRIREIVREEMGREAADRAAELIDDLRKRLTEGRVILTPSVHVAQS